MIGIVDYEAGNLKSVERAFSYLGADIFLSSDPEALRRADKIVFPGVGEAGSAMEVLKRTGLGSFLVEYAQTGKSLLGICLGSQILFDFSEESKTSCLGILPGTVRLFDSAMGLKIPHMGWNTITYRDHPLFKGVAQNSSFYFVHSYYVDPVNSNHILAESEYGKKFTAGVCRDNIMAFQFHPEKSGSAGLKILKNFINL